jgi:hypothetical protein
MKFISPVELMGFIVEHVFMEVRMGMRLCLEIISIVIGKIDIQEVDVPTVHLDSLINFSDCRIVEID